MNPFDDIDESFPAFSEEDMNFFAGKPPPEATQSDTESAKTPSLHSAGPFSGSNELFFPTFTSAPVQQHFPSFQQKFQTNHFFFSQQSQAVSPLYTGSPSVSPFGSSGSGGSKKGSSKKSKTKIVPADLSTGEIFKPKARKMPYSRWISSTPISARTDTLFNEFMLNPAAILNPGALKFLPSYFWPNKDVPFADIVTDYFQRKNNTNCRFIYKLYDALIIGQQSELYEQLVGVKWLTNYVLRVNKGQFARLLGIKSIDGSLFHQQGNFTTHGFIEIGSEDAPQYCSGVDISDVDFDEVRLLIHSQGIFVRGVDEISLINCKWVNEHKKH